MNKETLYEEFFNLVSEFCELNYGTNGCEYSSYIDGLVDMSLAIKRRIEKEGVEN